MHITVEKARIRTFLKGDEYMTYSEILKKVREECDMTQAEFAMYFNVPKRTYQDWEYALS